MKQFENFKISANELFSALAKQTQASRLCPKGSYSHGLKGLLSGPSQKEEWKGDKKTVHEGVCLDHISFEI